MESIWEKHFAQYERYLRSSRALSEKTITNYLKDLFILKEYLTIQELSLTLDESVLYSFLSRNGSISIASEYRSFMRDFISWLLEKRVISGGIGTGTRGHSRASIRRILASIRGFIRFLIEGNHLPDAELWHIRSAQMARITPKSSQKLPDLLSQKEAFDLINTAKTTATHAQSYLRNLALIEILYGCGLRVSEVSQLNWNHVNITQATVRVIGKGQKEREVPIGEHALSALVEYSMQHQTSTGPIFLNAKGNRLSNRSIQRIVHNYSVLSGLRNDIHPHTLRHSYATHLLDGGADLRIVQELLGHSTPSATQVYTHVSQGEAKKVYLNSHPLAKKDGLSR